MELYVVCIMMQIGEMWKPAAAADAALIEHTPKTRASARSSRFIASLCYPKVSLSGIKLVHAPRFYILPRLM
jgi:hypothetical protein